MPLTTVNLRKNAANSRNNLRKNAANSRNNLRKNAVNSRNNLRKNAVNEGINLRKNAVNKTGKAQTTLLQPEVGKPLQVAEYSSYKLPSWTGGVPRQMNEVNLTRRGGGINRKNS